MNLTKLFAKIFAVSPQTINFVADSKNYYLKRLYWLIPLTIWSVVYYNLNPLFLKFQVDSLTQNWTNIWQISLGATIYVFLTIVIIYLILNILDYIFKYIVEIFTLKLKQSTEAFLEDKFWNLLKTFDGVFLDGQNNIRIIRNLQWEITNIDRKFFDLVRLSIQGIVGIFALVAVLPLIHPYLILVAFFNIILGSFLDYLQNQTWRKYEILESRQNEERWDIKWGLINNFLIALSNNWLKDLLFSYNKIRANYFQTKYKQDQSDQFFLLLKNFLETLAYIGGILIAGYLFITGQIPLGTFVIFDIYISRFKNQLDILANMFRTFLDLKFQLFRFNFFINLKAKLDLTQIQDFKTNTINKIIIKNLQFSYPKAYDEEIAYIQALKKQVGIFQEIDQKQNFPKLQNLSLKLKIEKIWEYFKNKIFYQTFSSWQRENIKKELETLEKTLVVKENPTVLKSINLELKKGNIYAIVGYNGAGKTTLVKLLKRLIDPANGRIIIESNQKRFNLLNIDPLIWKEYLANLEQTSFLWESLSVRENLILGSNNPNLKDKTIFEALKKVGLEKIKNLNDKIGENLELSGGQKQLLEIARIYLQQKPVIILDEGTNQLDVEKEENILNILKEIKKNAIVIFITHRITTAAKCDFIVTLENGRITNFDKPKNLIVSNKDNLFKTFWQKQVGEFELLNKNT